MKRSAPQQRSQQQNINRFVFNLHVIIRVIVRAAAPSTFIFSAWHAGGKGALFFEVFVFAVNNHSCTVFALIPYHC